MVDSSLSTIKNKLVINLDDLVTQQDAVMLSKLSKQTGFFPELNFLVQFGGIIDSIVFSLTATKSGLGATTESQIQKMFDCVSLSLISLQRARLLRQKESSRNSVEGEVKGINELAEQDFPCIVIEGYMTHENSKQDHLYEKVANWASSLAEDGLANIVFVSSKPASAKSLDKALVSKPIEIVNLDDIPFDSAFAYVKSRVGGTITDLEASVKGVGGRRSDLDALILKIKTGLTAKGLLD